MSGAANSSSKKQKQSHGAAASGMAHFCAFSEMKPYVRMMFSDVHMTLACCAASLESPVDFPTSWKRTPASSHWITLQAVGEPSRFTHKQHGVQVPVPVRDRFQATIRIKKETVTCTIVAPNSASTVCYDMSVNPNGTNANAPCTLLIHPPYR